VNCKTVQLTRKPSSNLSATAASSPAAKPSHHNPESDSDYYEGKNRERERPQKSIEEPHHRRQDGGARRNKCDGDVTGKKELDPGKHYDRDKGHHQPSRRPEKKSKVPHRTPPRISKKKSIAPSL